jgi:hypothetical protein
MAAEVVGFDATATFGAREGTDIRGEREAETDAEGGAEGVGRENKAMGRVDGPEPVVVGVLARDVGQSEAASDGGWVTGPTEAFEHVPDLPLVEGLQEIVLEMSTGRVGGPALLGLALTDVWD